MRRTDRRRNRRIALPASLMILALLVAAVATAQASRAPTRAERDSLRAIVLEQCSATQPGCKFNGSRVSTVNPRFALANSGGFNYGYSVIYRRANAQSLRWRARTVIGGGLPGCRELLRAAPAKVLRDLRIQGFKSNGTTGYCG